MTWFVRVLRGWIAKQAIGKAAPWFILAIMLFAYAVRSMYIESCSMFVRGGVCVVRRTMGSTLAKLFVSALMFDYILTGPISGVSSTIPDRILERAVCLGAHQSYASHQIPLLWAVLAIGMNVFLVGKTC